MPCVCAPSFHGHALQAKLLEADAARREALKQLQDARSTADSERAQYEQQVRRAREEGSARITALEEVVKKLSNRSDLHEVGGLVQFIGCTNGCPVNRLAWHLKLQECDTA